MSNLRDYGKVYFVCIGSNRLLRLIVPPRPTVNIGLTRRMEITSPVTVQAITLATGFQQRRTGSTSCDHLLVMMLRFAKSAWIKRSTKGGGPGSAEAATISKGARPASIKVSEASEVSMRSARTVVSAVPSASPGDSELSNFSRHQECKMSTWNKCRGQAQSWFSLILISCFM